MSPRKARKRNRTGGGDKSRTDIAQLAARSLVDNEPAVYVTSKMREQSSNVGAHFYEDDRALDDVVYYGDQEKLREGDLEHFLESAHQQAVHDGVIDDETFPLEDYLATKQKQLANAKSFLTQCDESIRAYIDEVYGEGAVAHLEEDDLWLVEDEYIGAESVVKNLLTGERMGSFMDSGGDMDEDLYEQIEDEQTRLYEPTLVRFSGNPYPFTGKPGSYPFAEASSS